MAHKKYLDHLRSLPPISEIAARVRDGESYKDLAKELRVDQQGLANRLRTAGYRFDTGELEKDAQRRELKAVLSASLRTWWEPWMEDAACARVDPDAWFPEKGESPKAAKEICRTCPVIDLCREYVLARNERFGVWATMSERDRRKLQKGAVA